MNVPCTTGLLSDCEMPRNRYCETIAAAPVIVSDEAGALGGVVVWAGGSVALSLAPLLGSPAVYAAADETAQQSAANHTVFALTITPARCHRPFWTKASQGQTAYEFESDRRVAT